MMAMNSIIVLQEEVESVMECLDEAIIKKSNDGITFCNPVGRSILQNTYNILKSDKERVKHKSNTINNVDMHGGNLPSILEFKTQNL